MSILGIDHVQLAMPPGREDIARAFYEGVLGLSEIPKPADMAKRGGVEEGFAPARKAHPALLVDDLDRMVARLAKHGCEAIPGKPLAGYKRADIADPFGNRIELMQRV